MNAFRSNLLSKIISVGSRNCYDTKIYISTIKLSETTEEAGMANPCYEEDDEDDDAMSFRLSARHSHHSLSLSSDQQDWSPLNLNVNHGLDEAEMIRSEENISIL